MGVYTAETEHGLRTTEGLVVLTPFLWLGLPAILCFLLVKTHVPRKMIEKKDNGNIQLDEQKT